MLLTYRCAVRLLAVAALWLLPAVVCAQTPSPAPAPPAPEQPAPEAPPPDDGPKAAGVGSAQPPKPEVEAAEDDVEPEVVDPRGNLPSGVPESGTTLSSRPFLGLFGGAEPAAKRRHSLSLSGSLYGAYVKNVSPAPVDGVSDPRAGLESLIAGGSGAMNYSRSWDAGSIGAFLNGSRAWAEQYSDDGDPWINRWDVGLNAGFSKALSRRTRFRASGSVGYSPYLQLGNQFDFGSGNIASLPPTAGLDFAVVRDPSLTTDVGSGVSVSLSSKSSIDAYVGGRFQTFVSSDAQNLDRSDVTGGARYNYRFGRFLGAHAGYAYQRSDVGTPDAEPFTRHNLDLGLNSGYGRSYALTRRTTFSFSTDSSLFLAQDLNPGDAVFDPETRVFIGGSADLTHTIGRSWVARTGYRRSVGYVAGFSQPLLSDTGFAAVSGLVAPRLDFNAATYYTAGNVGFSGADNGFASTSSSVGLRYAITRNLATYAQYFYYHYLFESGVTLPGYLAPELDRQGVTVGLTAWLPLIGSRGRR